jgi:hypothetical protein
MDSNMKKNKTDIIGIKKIQEYLLQNNYHFEEEYSFSDLKDKRKLFFDFIVYDENKSVKCLIEFQDEQQYSHMSFFGDKLNFFKSKARDLLKVEYCKKNKLPLLKISFDKTESINEILDRFFKSLNFNYDFLYHMDNFPEFYFEKALGTHLLIDFYDCKCKIENLSFIDEIKNIFPKSCEEGNLTIVNENYKQLETFGVSVCITLAESSLTAHSYPEHSFISIDIFYCGKDVKVEKTISTLFVFFEPSLIKINSFPRGIFV